MMKKKPTRKRVVPTDVDVAHRTETVAEYLARGGQIIKCPTRRAAGVPNSQMIYVDGQGIPTMNSPGEYVPGFVCDVVTYDAAQEEAPRPEDNGTTAYWREYEQSSIPSAWRPDVVSATSRYEGDES